MHGLNAHDLTTLQRLPAATDATHNREHLPLEWLLNVWKFWELCPVKQLFVVTLKWPNWPWQYRVSHSTTTAVQGFPICQHFDFHYHHGGSFVTPQACPWSCEAYCEGSAIWKFQDFPKPGGVRLIHNNDSLVPAFVSNLIAVVQNAIWAHSMQLHKQIHGSWPSTTS